jgi:folate-dependent phosphoribosylglycinamide formyltransferase PurN
MPAATKLGSVARLSRYRNPTALWRQLQARTLLPRFERRAAHLHRELFWHAGRPPDIPDVAPVRCTPDVNSEEAVNFIRGLAPDIVLVNGTQLLRTPVLALMPELALGVVNLHTGLSPYSRGGNCNLFMLLEGRPELVGVTVHHIDAGIDSGDIISSAQVPMEAEDTFEMIEARSFHLGVDLLLTAARQMQRGQAARVKQWDEGKLFLRRTGYQYEPYYRLAANRLLQRGLVKDYLAHKEARDRGIRLVRTVA